MSYASNRLSIIKRLLLATLALVAFMMASVIGAHRRRVAIQGHREFEEHGSFGLRTLG